MQERDITDFRSIVENSKDLIQIVNPEGIILYANQSWQKTLGFSIHEIVGNSIYNFISDNSRNKFKVFRENLIENMLFDVFVETILKAKSGKEINVEGFMCAIYEGKQPKYTHAILRDVSLRKQQEEEMDKIHKSIVEREHQLKQLIEHAPDAIIVIDEESKIVLWNPKCELLFGWTAKEVIGKYLGDTIIPEQYRKMHYEGMKRFFLTGEANVLDKTIEVTALNKTGVEFNIALTISKTLHNEATQFIAFIRDISVNKKMENDLKLHQHELEKKNEELAHYASMTTHDLKEPIRKILTFTDLLTNNTALSAKLSADKLLRKIKGEAEKMSSLVDGIASLSNINLSKIELNRVNLNQILNEVIENLDHIIQEKKALINHTPLPYALIDKLHGYQLFHNLLSNALKYTNPEISPKIEITWEKLNSRFIRISFSDNGLGFDDQFSQKVFEPFERLHGREFEGTGIGLAICKKIVEAYGGSITVKSQNLKGSTFIFSIPIDIQ
ncbi:MAG TPA: PAS domain S-box protein [Flavitalea sp.]|nr:PAS domain S-box protein [Flavitalea sp.]